MLEELFKGAESMFPSHAQKFVQICLGNIRGTPKVNSQQGLFGAQRLPQTDRSITLHVHNVPGRARTAKGPTVLLFQYVDSPWHEQIAQDPTPWVQVMTNVMRTLGC